MMLQMTALGGCKISIHEKVSFCDIPNNVTVFCVVVFLAVFGVVVDVPPCQPGVALILISIFCTHKNLGIWSGSLRIV